MKGKRLRKWINLGGQTMPEEYVDQLRADIRDGVLNIMVWSNGMATIAPGNGDVLSFRVLLGNEPQTIALNANKVTLTDANGNALNASATSGALTIAAAKAQLAPRDIDFGHIPIRSVYHQSLLVTNVGNIPLIISGIEPSAVEFSSETPFPYEIAAGTTGYVDITYSPVERGSIEETVRLLSNNIAGTNTIRIVADPFAVNELHVENASGIADSDMTKTSLIAIKLGIAGFIVPFFFLDNPVLLYGSTDGVAIGTTIYSFATAMVGVLALASGLAGLPVRKDSSAITAVRIFCRALLAVAGILFISPSLITDGIALLLITMQFVLDRMVLARAEALT